jgi:hypothetical protein
MLRVGFFGLGKADLCEGGKRGPWDI